MHEVGPYVLLAPIAAGGFGKVFLARRRNVAGFGRLFAMKCLHDRHVEDGAALAMLIDEARLASRISHTNVLSVIDVVEHQGALWLVMEYEEGESLARLLASAEARAEPASIAVVTAIVTGALRGLHAAHEARGADQRPLGLVHRDVSPHNVLVTCHGVAKLHDFGIAKASGRLALTEPGQIKGKLSYMAPEQLAAGEVDRRTDLYSMGIVLWEGLAGRRLFESATPLLAERRPDGPAIAAQLDVPDAVRAVVAKALRTHPGARYESAAAMAHDLESATRVATEREVAAWVTAVAADALASRRALLEAGRCASGDGEKMTVSSDETQSAVEIGEQVAEPPPPAAAPTPTAPLEPLRPAPGRVRRSARLLYAAAAAAGVGLASVAVFATRSSPATVASVPPTAADPLVASTPAPPAEPARPLLTSARASSPAAPAPSAPALPAPAPSAPATRPIPGPSGSPPALRPSAHPPSCDPPYTISDKGVKVLKVECIR
ncbi:MAG: serine/threonine protein kinase [Myxococcales bacterium]|nr:serine/threonine protein kinase [Myxococcales bacterium]